MVRISILLLFLMAIGLFQDCAPPSSGGSAFGINLGGGNGTAASSSPLTLAFSSPANNSTISGTTQLSVVASDVNIVTSVQFAIDGTNAGAPATVSPYTVSIDASTLSAGSHVILATGIDSLGNQGSASISVNVVAVAATPPPLPTPPITSLSCVGTYLLNTTNGYSNVLVTITAGTGNAISGTMNFSGFAPFQIAGTCTSSSSSEGSISFVRTQNGGNPSTWTGTYSNSVASPSIINMSGSIVGGSIKWTAVTD
jgi:hypothetical protein